MDELTRRLVSREAILALLVASAALWAPGCGGDDITSPTTGSLTITTSTSGPDPDADGYAVRIDDGSEISIISSGTLQRDNVESGNHIVQLSGMAANCTVLGDNPRSVSVSTGQTVTVTFELTCSAATGGLKITTTTLGPDPDPDGYTFAVDGGTDQVIGPNATITVANVAAAAHTVALSGVAENCSIGGGNPGTVTVAAGATAEVTFAVTCAAATTFLIAFTSIESGEPFVFVVKPDGTGLTKLAAGSTPVWSPDKRKILFQRDDNLYVMNADGTGQMQLAQRHSDDPRVHSRISSYRWSPDGTRVAFVSWACDNEHCIPFAELSIMRADGSGIIKLADAGWEPSWSPDGRRIAYMWNIQAESRIQVINADGSGDTRLEGTSSASNPDWSPDGSSLVFTQGLLEERDVFLINPDGTGPVNLTPDPGPPSAFSARWSPDGTRIVFYTFYPDQKTAIAVMNRDGSGQRELTSNHNDYNPIWSPDGGQIVFTRESEGHSQSDVLIMNADGTGERRLSSRSESKEPDW
jgi:Tol biopolymer transport system component